MEQKSRNQGAGGDLEGLQWAHALVSYHRLPLLLLTTLPRQRVSQCSHPPVQGMGVRPEPGSQNRGAQSGSVAIPEGQSARRSCHPGPRSAPGSGPAWSLVLQLSQRFWTLAQVRFWGWEPKTPNWYKGLIGSWGACGARQAGTSSPRLLQPKGSVGY